MEAVAWGVAAFVANPSASDDEIERVLVDAGVPRALAARCVLVLPLAFGRLLLRGLVSAPDEIIEGDERRVLSTDPVFAAATRLAERATREQMERVALRSSEVSAVNSALHAGAKPEGLVMSAPQTGACAAAEADPAWAQTMLVELAAAHGSTLDWQAHAFPRELKTGFAKMQLDVVVNGIVESFAGMGATIHDATAEALAKFARGSLHVVLAAVEGQDSEQVTWEDWGAYRACIGPLLQQWATPPPMNFAAYLDAVKERLLAEPLAKQLHWHRTFVAVGDNELYGFDSLLDNQTWAPELVENWPWPRGEKPYALRLFVALVPAPPP